MRDSWDTLLWFALIEDAMRAALRGSDGFDCRVGLGVIAAVCAGTTGPEGPAMTQPVNIEQGRGHWPGSRQVAGAALDAQSFERGIGGEKRVPS
jgi:hypothetical protein